MQLWHATLACSVTQLPLRTRLETDGIKSTRKPFLYTAEELPLCAQRCWERLSAATQPSMLFVLSQLRRAYSIFLERMESAGSRPHDVGEPSGPQPIVATDGSTIDGANLTPPERAPQGPRLPRPNALGTAGAATAAAALRRTRTAMARELQRMSAVGEAVEKDSAAIDTSRQRHAEYAGAVQDSHARISAYQVRTRAFV